METEFKLTEVKMKFRSCEFRNGKCLNPFLIKDHKDRCTGFDSDCQWFIANKEKKKKR